MKLSKQHNTNYYCCKDINSVFQNEEYYLSEYHR